MSVLRQAGLHRRSRKLKFYNDFSPLAARATVPVRGPQPLHDSIRELLSGASRKVSEKGFLLDQRQLVACSQSFGNHNSLVDEPLRPPGSLRESRQA